MWLILLSILMFFITAIVIFLRASSAKQKRIIQRKQELKYLYDNEEDIEKKLRHFLNYVDYCDEHDLTVD
jgi:hypothetical protein